MRRRSGLWAWALVLVAGPAEGQPLELEGPVPCTALELLQAVELRVDVRSLGEPIVVRGLPDSVEVSYGGRSRALAMGALRGVQAARRLALAIIDLVREERALGRAPGPLLAEPTATASAALAEPPVPARATSPALSRARYVERPTTLDAVVVLWAGFGSELDRPVLGAALTASLALVADLRASLGLGVTWSPPASLGSVSVSTVGVPLRGGLGVRWSEVDLELRLQGVLTPLWVTGLDAEREASRVDWLGAAGVMLEYRVPTEIEVALQAGVDLTLNPIEYRAHERRTVATDRWLGWVGAGVGFEVLP